jgi:glucan phosphoethanolaminetransferase (alkaline phosphatase superfamily)
MSYDDGYQQGYYEGKSARRTAETTRSFISMIFAFFFLFLQFLYYCVIFSGGLILAHLLLKSLGVADKTGTWEYLLYLFGIGYVMVCLIFFIKGIMIQYRIAQNKIWIPLFVLCLSVVCLIPIVLFRVLIYDWFFRSYDLKSATTLLWPTIASWLLAIGLGGFVYSKYKLTEDYVINLAAWSYILGIKAGKKLNS